MSETLYFIQLLVLVSVLLPFFGASFRVVRKLVQVLCVPTFWGCIALMGWLNLGRFTVGENTKKRFPQESLASIHLLTSGIILFYWYLGFKNGLDILEIQKALIGLYVFNLICLAGVLLISKFSTPKEEDKDKDWIDQLLDYRISLGFYKKLTE